MQAGFRSPRRVAVALGRPLALALPLVLLLSLLAAPPAAMAGPALLFEPKGGLVLYAEDADMRWHPASLTKLMTAYLTFKAIKAGRLSMDSKITCSANANREPPSKLGLPVGAQISVRLALKVLIVKSANDVAVMLAEAVAGSERAFVRLMNRTAKRLGMLRTRFINPNGLPDARQITTARDMARLARAIILEFPEYADLFALPSVRVGRRVLRSHNSLLRTFEGADGMKTGFICASGYNVVASATRDGRRLVAVVLGETTAGARVARAAELLEHGFRTYGWKAVFESASIETLPLFPARLEGPVNLRQRACRHRYRRARSARRSRARARAARLRRARAAARARARNGAGAPARAKAAPRKR